MVVRHAVQISLLLGSQEKKVSQKELQNVLFEKKILSGTLTWEPRFVMRGMRTLKKTLIANGKK